MTFHCGAHHPCERPAPAAGIRTDHPSLRSLPSSCFEQILRFGLPNGLYPVIDGGALVGFG